MAAMKLDGVDKEISISLDTPSCLIIILPTMNWWATYLVLSGMILMMESKETMNRSSGVKIYLDQNGNGQWDYTDSISTEVTPTWTRTMSRSFIPMPKVITCKCPHW